MPVLTWLVENWQTILLVLTSIVTGASIIVRAISPYTSTTKDDDVATFLDRVHDWLNKLALNPPRSL